MIGPIILKTITHAPPPTTRNQFYTIYSTLFAGFNKKSYLCVNMDNKDRKCTSRIS